uniref:Uncharacterized protein n=1 Tax=Romanomermis culicivorax TaxID=13658 RepID=A0A915L977_ROMCU
MNSSGRSWAIEFFKQPRLPADDEIFGLKLCVDKFKFSGKGGGGGGGGSNGATFDYKIKLTKIQGVLECQINEPKKI